MTGVRRNDEQLLGSFTRLQVDDGIINIGTWAVPARFRTSGANGRQTPPLVSESVPTTSMACCCFWAELPLPRHRFFSIYGYFICLSKRC